MKEWQIDIQYGTIKGLLWGEKNTKNILALHGWLDNAASFCQLAPLLAEQGYRVLAIDFAGHGHSDHRAPGHFTHFIDYVLDIQSVLTQLQWQRPILLGHSMGAAMAQMVAATQAKDIEKLIMIENLGPVPAYEPGSAADNLTVALQQWKNHDPEHKNHYSDIETALKARLMVTPMADEVLRPMVERGLKKTEKGYHWRTDKRLRLRSLFRFSEETVQDMLSAPKPPTQLIVAKPWTYALSYPQVEQRQEKLAADEVIAIDGHHHLHMDNAHKVGQAIIEFLKRDFVDTHCDEAMQNLQHIDGDEFNELSDQ